MYAGDHIQRADSIYFNASGKYTEERLEVAGSSKLPTQGVQFDEAVLGIRL